MSLINFILDIAGLLLWLSWRSIWFDPLRRATPATLVGTVRRAEPPRLKRWHFLAGLFALLFIRTIFYVQIGPAVNWTPKLDLVVVTLAFPLVLRGHVFLLSALLFSVLSFFSVWIIVHFWLIALAIINGPASKPDPFQKLILLHLGRIARWPLVAQALLPGLLTAVVWIGFHPLLARAGVVDPTPSMAHLLGQGALVGTVLYLSLKSLLPAFLFLHLVASYVYLGSSPLWDFINHTARRLLVPLNRLPLRWGKVDFAPLVGIVLILLLLHAGPMLVLNELSRRNLTLWPQ
jgi:uncharacterized protein YggT (Ycf19 family)